MSDSFVTSRLKCPAETPPEIFTYFWRQAHPQLNHSLLIEAVDDVRCTHWLQLQPHIPAGLKIAACVLISYPFVSQVLLFLVEEGLETPTPLV